MILGYVRVSTVEQNEARQMETMKKYEVEKIYSEKVSSKENIDSSTATGKLMLTMVAAINELERANLLERQRESIAIAKSEGKYKGRKAYTIDDKFITLYEKYKVRQINKTQLAKELNISRPSLDRLIKEFNNN